MEDGMTWLWDALIRHIVGPAGAALAWSTATAAHIMTPRDVDGVRGTGVERRVDGATADVIEAGVLFMAVFGRANAEAFFHTADVEPAVHGRIVRGRVRRLARGGRGEPESVPA
jgi:hypothetical protein